jgi:DNA-binding NarL/FixJ family response regulator
VARVLLVDDHPSFRQALAFMLRQEPEVNAVAQAGSLAEARGVLAGAGTGGNGGGGEVDVAVLDLDLPDGHGAELIKDVRAACPDARVLILTASTDRYATARAVEMGADGVLLKTATIEEILDAVRRLAAGEQLLSQREVIELLRLVGQRRQEERAARRALDQLTAREREVLQALADGLSDQEMAERLQLSVRTARTHMVNILAKLRVESRLQALIFALRHGIARLD